MLVLCGDVCYARFVFLWVLVDVICGVDVVMVLVLVIALGGFML